MKQRIIYALIITLSLTLNACQTKKSDDWIILFNGKNLDGWIPKFAGHPLNENYLNTFTVENGVLKASYKNYTQFDRKFGHLFYEKPFSHYILQLEYRFVGEQVENGPKWAFRNNGVMLHSQPPQSMTLKQPFPASAEVQLLGGDGSTPRTTANICTPSTHIEINKELITKHCTLSTSQTYHGDQWVKLEVEVHGDEKIIHRINGEQVLEYQRPSYDPRNRMKLNFVGSRSGQTLKEGYIALQAESHGTEFRNIRLKNLKP